MHIGFDISQTGANKAGCGYYAYALIQALLQTSPENRRWASLDIPMEERPDYRLGYKIGRCMDRFSVLAENTDEHIKTVVAFIETGCLRMRISACHRWSPWPPASP